MYKLGDKTLESSLMEKQEGVWIDGNLNMSQQCPASQEGSCVLESLKHSSASWAREMIVPLYFVLVLQLCVQLWELHSTIRTIRVCPKEADIIPGLTSNAIESTEIGNSDSEDTGDTGLGLLDPTIAQLLISDTEDEEFEGFMEDEAADEAADE
ncbi:hypothetical protein TURU_002442 [Turdus rufiventris]|nr:hypothetical protein TURU_002442 [Turdus rufiventris]